MTNGTRTIIFSALLVLALLGLADASYLTYEHYSGGEVVCSVVDGCNEVLESPYATIASIPLAALGVVYYLALAFLAAAILHTTKKKRRFLGAAALISGVGFVTSLVFVYLQAVVIEAWCLYCLTSAALTTLFFAISLPMYIYINSTDI